MDLNLLHVFDEGPVVFFVWSNSDDFKVDYVSPNVEGLVGLTSEAIVTDKMPFLEWIHPEDRSPWLAAFTEMRSGSARSVTHQDFRLRNQSGDYIWVQQQTYAERDQEGQIRVFSGYLLDVTQRHQDEERLRKSKERFELVLEGTRLGMWDWNPQTNEVAFNDLWAEMLGHTLDEVPFNLESWQSRVHPDDLQACYDDLSDHMEGKVPFYENVHRMRHKQGHWVYILDRGKIMECDAEGKPTRFTGTHTDITPQKVAEQQAYQAAEAKTLFLATMSHEIRTPLNGILGMNQLMKYTDLTGRQQTFVDAIEQSGEMLRVIIDDILDYSKIEAGKLELDVHPYAPAQVMDSLRAMFIERASRKNVELEVEIAADVPEYILGDSYRIRQILANLISNAVKFTEQGVVKILVSKSSAVNDGISMTFAVVDQGPGIAEPDKIWEAFTQENTGITRQYGGTGLGLSICKRLANIMDGALELQTALGQGSTFTFSYPTRVAQRSKQGVLSKDRVDLSKLSVLVAEDNPINQMVVRGFLERMKNKPHMVKNGKEALEALRQSPYDVVLMDIHMPEMDGLHATKLIREELSRQPYIVALTADVMDASRQQCLAAGMNDILTKPIQFGQLAEVLLQRLP